VVIGEERKDGTDYLGSTSIAHIAEVPVQMVLGRDDEIIISTPKKNRDTDDKVSRCFFRRTPIGLVEISEADTGYLPRRKEKELVGLAAFVTKEGDEYFVDEMTVTFNSDVKKSTLNVNGMNHSKCNSLLLLLKKELIITTAGIFVRANRTEKPIDDSELACLMAILSRMLNKPIPVDAVFIGGVNNLGYLLPVGGMEKRVKRALALGYKRIIGPAALGSQNVNWEEFETLESVKKEFFQ
jgi:DNA repair protein RadA/Sms